MTGIVVEIDDRYVWCPHGKIIGWADDDDDSDEPNMLWGMWCRECAWQWDRS